MTTVSQTTNKENIPVLTLSPGDEKDGTPFSEATNSYSGRVKQKSLFPEAGNFKQAHPLSLRKTIIFAVDKNALI